MTKDKLKTVAAQIGISEIGVSRAEPFDDLWKALENSRKMQPPSSFEEYELEKRCDPSVFLPGAKSIVVCLFPYYSKYIQPDNLSRYSCVRDYHIVVMEKLEQLAGFLRREISCSCKCASDNWPLADRYLAHRAGLGFYGRNRMLINRRFGSYFFIGSIVTDAELDPDVPLENTCLQCGKCAEACPGGALRAGAFDYNKCISYLTQAKELSHEQMVLLGSQKKIYGCDVCQEVCPHNYALPDTAMEEFLDGYIEHLPEDDILFLSNREFLKKYREYPFSWRGRKVLARNLQQKELDKIRD